MMQEFTCFPSFMPVCKLLDFSVKTKYILHQNQLNIRSAFSTPILLLATEKRWQLSAMFCHDARVHLPSEFQACMSAPWFFCQNETLTASRWAQRQISLQHPGSFVGYWKRWPCSTLFHPDVRVLLLSELSASMSPSWFPVQHCVRDRYGSQALWFFIGLFQCVQLLIPCTKCSYFSLVRLHQHSSDLFPALCWFLARH